MKNRVGPQIELNNAFGVPYDVKSALYREACDLKVHGLMDILLAPLAPEAYEEAYVAAKHALGKADPTRPAILVTVHQMVGAIVGALAIRNRRTVAELAPGSEEEECRVSVEEVRTQIELCKKFNGLPPSCIYIGTGHKERVMAMVLKVTRSATGQPMPPPVSWFERLVAMYFDVPRARLVTWTNGVFALPATREGESPAWQ